MEREEIMEDVVAAINGITGIVPKKWRAIRSFHLKLLDSLALPVYQAVPDLKLKIEAVREENEDEEEEVREEKKKGRIHEVRYMDDNADVEDELKSYGKDNIDDNADVGSGELAGKKRKKGDIGKDEKKEEKVAKVKREDVFKQKKEALAF